MFRKTAITLFCFVLGFHVAFAQNANKQNVIQWEFLEVSGSVYSDYYLGGKKNRNYNYLTSGESFRGLASLEWIKNSGWEMVTVVFYGESGSNFFFKRRYDKKRTDDEIKWLKNETEKETVVIKPSVLIDLDEIEFKQKLADFNKNEEVRIRNALEQIKELPIKIISVSSKSRNPNESEVGAEIVLDATSVLLKDGKYYRASEAEKYYLEAAKRILDKTQVSLQSSLEGNSERISKGWYQLQTVGKFDFYGGVNIKVSVIIIVNGQQNIVSQGVVNGRWKTEGK